VTRAERYVELALRLGRHEPDLVDFYYGPPDLRRRVDAEPLSEPKRLAADAGELLAELEDPWLTAQVRALETTARIMAGEELPRRGGRAEVRHPVAAAGQARGIV